VRNKAEAARRLLKASREAKPVNRIGVRGAKTMNMKVEKGVA